MQQTIQKLKPSQILRETKAEQCFYSLSNGEGKFCAVGVLYNYLGWDGESNSDLIGDERPLLLDLGIHQKHVQEIFDMNDNMGWSFNQIADWLEERGL
jgi:hypothetical protein